MLNLRLLAVSALLAVPVSGPLAATSEYPNKPIRYVTGSSAGGAGDMVARTITPAMSEGLGVQFVTTIVPGRAIPSAPKS